MKNIIIDFIIGYETDIMEIFDIINYHLNYCLMHTPEYYVSGIERTYNEDEDELENIIIGLYINHLSEETINKLKSFPCEDGNYRIEITERD